MEDKVLIERNNANLQEVLIQPTASDFVHLVSSGHLKHFSQQESRTLAYFRGSLNRGILIVQGILTTIALALVGYLELLKLPWVLAALAAIYLILGYVIYRDRHWTKLVVPRDYNNKIKQAMNNDDHSRPVDIVVRGLALDAYGRSLQETKVTVQRLSQTTLKDLRMEFRDIRSGQPKDLYISNEDTDREWIEGRVSK